MLVFGQRGGYNHEDTAQSGLISPVLSSED